MSRSGGGVPSSTPRLDTVDLLRGLSILGVVLLHTYLRLLFNGYPLEHRLPHVLAHLFFFNGGNGVTIFFAVSGFLITLTSLRRFGRLGALRPGAFYRIRFARIGPSLLLTVAVLSLLALLHTKGFAFSARNPPLWRAVFAALTFHLNWLEARYGFLPANWDVLWSLSVEEMFYLFFPVVCLVCLRFRRGDALFVAVLIAFIAMGPFARGIWTNNEIWQEKSYLGGMDGIALGCLTALLAHRMSLRDTGKQRHAHKTQLAVCEGVGAALIVLNALGPHWYWRLFPRGVDLTGTVLALAACLVMLPAALREPFAEAGLAQRLTMPLRWYGRHSYEVYLTHEFVVVWAVSLFLHWHPNRGNGVLAPQQPSLALIGLWFTGIVLLTAGLGWLVARYFSEPWNLRLRGARPPR